MSFPVLCDYHASVYAMKSTRLRILHHGILDDLRDEAAMVARQCPACVKRAKEPA